MKSTVIAAALICTATFAAIQAQDKYPDDPAMPTYTLPAALRFENGTAVTTPDQWKQSRRPEILELFRTHFKGRVPATTNKNRFPFAKEKNKPAGAPPTRRRVKTKISRNKKTLIIHEIFFFPKKPANPAPLSLLISTRGPKKIDPTRQ